MEDENKKSLDAAQDELRSLIQRNVEFSQDSNVGMYY